MQSAEVGSTSSSGCGEAAGDRKYKGVRRRRWGKWVSEIRVPASRERLWLGSYSNPEAAAVAHDAAVFFLRGPGAAEGFNFPERVGRFVWAGLSPRSVQKVASDSGMAVDAELTIQKTEMAGKEKDDVAGCGAIEWETNGWDPYISFDDVDFYM